MLLPDDSLDQGRRQDARQQVDAQARNPEPRTIDPPTSDRTCCSFSRDLTAHSASLAQWSDLLHVDNVVSRFADGLTNQRARQSGANLLN